MTLGKYMYDLAIIGGGINGCGIARDASLRGLKVILLEKGDLAGATSSASSKLIHGGLRYLEHYKFRLVREALKEREVLLKIAPQIIYPLRFTLPHHKGLRPKWLLRLGLFIYDHLDFAMTLPKTKSVKLANELKPEFTDGFEYSDLWVDDARLVIINAIDARNHGAEILTHTPLVSAQYSDHWLINGTIKAKAMINASGAWVNEVNALCGIKSHAGVRHVKGSHLILKRKLSRPYIFQSDDGRVLFAIPYERDFMLLGTTDVDVTGNYEKPVISEIEIDYILKEAAIYFENPPNRTEIVASYAGIRPLYDDGASDAKEATRDYVLIYDALHHFLSVYGGKITTYRRLAEEALKPFTDVKSTTATTPLPITPTFKTLNDEAIAYYKREEWANSMDDILYRRTKKYLYQLAHLRP
jgi:glycerol-3-phosphate dehydrogenase